MIYTDSINKITETALHAIATHKYYSGTQPEQAVRQNSYGGIWFIKNFRFCQPSHTILVCWALYPLAKFKSLGRQEFWNKKSNILRAELGISQCDIMIC